MMYGVGSDGVRVWVLPGVANRRQFVGSLGRREARVYVRRGEAA